MNSMRKFPSAKGNAKKLIVGKAYFMEYTSWKLLHVSYIFACMESKISMGSEDSNPK